MRGKVSPQQKHSAEMTEERREQENKMERGKHNIHLIL